MSYERPGLVCSIHALAAPGANTNIIAASNQLGTGVSYAPTRERGAHYLDVWVALATASVFNARVTDGTTAYARGLNESSALQAGDLYRFSLPCPSHNHLGVQLTYDFQVETNGVIQTLVVYRVMQAAR